MVGVELCGVLGRLHSIEGLAQSNNNVKLNYRAKHEQKLLITSEKKNGGEQGEVGRAWKGKREA
jgi:hypothetical protein